MLQCTILNGDDRNDGNTPMHNACSAGATQSVKVSSLTKICPVRTLGYSFFWFMLSLMSILCSILGPSVSLG